MITQQEFQQRRQKLAMMLAENSIAIIASAKEVNRNSDTTYRFHQSSNFYYLTGFNEPDAILLITSGSHSESILFNRPNHPGLEQWNGKRLGQAEALSQLGMSKSFSIDDCAQHLPQFLANQSHIYFNIGQDSVFDSLIIEAFRAVKTKVRQGIKAPFSLDDLEPLLSEMRLIKSPAEIQLMKHAAAISVRAHQQAMLQCKHKSFEYELEATVVYEMINRGCKHLAYDSIVGGGKNACTLHYVDNSAKLTPGELVLIDAGCEYQGYASDITRTFPINGVFSPEQKALYNLVLKAQQAGIACIKPGIKWSLIQQTIVSILTQGLCDLGLLQGDINALIANEAYKTFYMHSSGHWLGLDVHDSGRYKINNEWRTLEAGMVLTVEPGLYISPQDTVEKKWWNIGIRIEDDVLVTATGHENLTGALPVEVSLIEALMRG